MKTRLFILALLAYLAPNVLAQSKVIVEAKNYDISYNLDLEAVATLFGESRDLEEFEWRLNDYDSGISNLDLNHDGEVDYLRVVESREKNLHVIVIQAVLERDVFQDVATIVVDGKRKSKAYVQIIGNPYMYGTNYILEPIYVRQPPIYSVFWGRNYRVWYSPYYWGYYPTYYRYRVPVATHVYVTNVHVHVNRHYTYNYTTHIRNKRVGNVYSSVSRNDYGTRYPDRSFSGRNQNVSNTRELRSSDNRSGRVSSESGRQETNQRPGRRESVESTRPGRTSTEGTRVDRSTGTRPTRDTNTPARSSRTEENNSSTSKGNTDKNSSTATPGRNSSSSSSSVQQSGKNERNDAGTTRSNRESNSSVQQSSRNSGSSDSNTRSSRQSNSSSVKQSQPERSSGSSSTQRSSDSSGRSSSSERSSGSSGSRR